MSTRLAPRVRSFKLLRLPDGTVKVLVEGKRRVRIKNFLQTDGSSLFDCGDIIETIANETEAKALVRSVKSTFETYVNSTSVFRLEILMRVSTNDDIGELATLSSRNSISSLKTNKKS